MTPVFLNSAPSPKFPFVELKEEHHDPKFFLPVNKYEGGSSDQQQASSSSSSSLQPTVDHNTTNGQDSSFGSTGDNMGISVKWMSSKMRLMKKMTDSDQNNNNKAVKFTHKFQYPIHDYNGESNSLGKANNNTIRVCSDCNTTTTPLWRSGPRGPKSLCNACGIRQRKARRAMEAAAAGTVAENSGGVAKEAPISMKIKIPNTNNNKEKKPRIGQLKKQQFKAASDNYNSQQTQKKLFFKEFALTLSNNSSALQRVFPQDVEDAAILLMELSCGLVHT